jgi:hypothetical protein
MSEEEFDFGDLDLKLDEGTEARIAHLEFLEKVKAWGQTMGLVAVPFSHMAQSVIDAEEEGVPGKVQAELYLRVATALPMGAAILIENLNELYELIQAEAVRVMGVPFAMHEQHHPNCDGTREYCGHQDHFTSIIEKKEGDE